MTVRQFYRSWWGWLLFAAIIVAFGFYRRWDNFSFALLAVLSVTGVLRALLVPFRKITIKRIAADLGKLPADQRKKELEKIAPEFRAEVQKEIDRLGR